MAEPQSKEEYERRFKENHRIEGFGLDVRTVAPCPFCAAPDWQVWPIMTTQEAMAAEATCSECGRSGKAIVKRSADGVSAEFVQTGGADPPSWLPPIRRVS